MSKLSTNYIDLLRAHAATCPEKPAYFMWADDLQWPSLTYGALDYQARTIAALLQQRGVPGQPVLLVLPPGFGYAAAFFGCLYAGAIAVPAMPPGKRGLSRLAGILKDSTAMIGLTTAALRRQIQRTSAPTPESSTDWIAIDEISAVDPDRWDVPAIDGERIASLQYTSGSIDEPMGVKVTHANLIHNSEMIAKAFGYSCESRCVSWLPPIMIWA